VVLLALAGLFGIIVSTVWIIRRLDRGRTAYVDEDDWQ
jgi:hypothetical protein